MSRVSRGMYSSRASSFPEHLPRQARRAGATTRASGPKLWIQLRSGRSSQTVKRTSSDPSGRTSISCERYHSRSLTNSTTRGSEIV